MAGAGTGGRGVLRLALGVLVALALAGCASVYRTHGYVPTEDELAAVTVGRSTREAVADAVGRPSAGGVMAGGAWYYVQSRWRHFGARAPQEIDRQVVAISFSDRGTVTNIERFGLAEGRVVTLSQRVTDSTIRGSGLLRQLLGNLGNFNPGQFIN
jgi:outer membrane protein assembly factor BamE (lipoprotein component of BamABCDE complex)